MKRRIGGRHGDEINIGYGRSTGVTPQAAVPNAYQGAEESRRMKEECAAGPRPGYSRNRCGQWISDSTTRQTPGAKASAQGRVKTFRIYQTRKSEHVTAHAAEAAEGLFKECPWRRAVAKTNGSRSGKTPQPPPSTGVMKEPGRPWREPEGAPRARRSRPARGQGTRAEASFDAGDQLQKLREDARKPIPIYFEGTMPTFRDRGHLQARRELSHEMRDARYNAYSDVGVA